jgi:hypothetical protein
MKFVLRLPQKDERAPFLYTPMLLVEGHDLLWSVHKTDVDGLIHMITRHEECGNATLSLLRTGASTETVKGEIYGNPSGTRLCIDTGSIALARFETALCVAVTEIQSASQQTLGYVLAFPDGTVRKVSLGDVITYCRNVRKRGGIAVQNMQFVGASAGASPHLKNYPGYSIPIYTVQRAAVNAEGMRVSSPARTEPPSLAEKPGAEQVFTPEQLEVLGRGKNEGLDIRVYANPAYSPLRMNAVRRVLLAGKSPAFILDPKLSDEMAVVYSLEITSNADIRPYYNTAYDHRQMTQVKLGVIRGLDVSKYADPSISADEMEQRRVRMDADAWSKI